MMLNRAPAPPTYPLDMTLWGGDAKTTVVSPRLNTYGSKEDGELEEDLLQAHEALPSEALPSEAPA